MMILIHELTLIFEKGGRGQKYAFYDIPQKMRVD